MGIAPDTALALAVQSNKGVYALLLGSGVSRAAGVPTGWEVVLHLIRRVAKAKGKDPGANPAQWFKQQFDIEPTYSNVIEQVAPKRAERELLLREFFEPTEQEREEGLKQPTAAHRAIAKLVADGYVRVILTTNFDRLTERALQDEGISPTVVSSADQAQGALPPQHTRCLVVKIHGDYLDTRLRNTADELAAYEPELQKLLERILEEYGVIICGWSAEWDMALADTLERTTRHRFTTFWMVRDKSGDRASRIIKHRHAMVVPIESADAAFVDLSEKVGALEGGTVADPLSPAVAVATLKRLISDENRNRVRIDDFFMDEARRLHQKFAGQWRVDQPAATKESYAPRVAGIEASMSILIPCACTGVRWGSDGLHDLWRRCIELLAKEDPPRSGITSNPWEYLRRYPATLLIYGIGVVAAYYRRPSLLRALLVDTKWERVGVREKPPLVWVFNARGALYHDAAQWLFPENRHTPGSDRMESALKAMLAGLFDHEDQFENAFDDFEIILAFALASIKERPTVGRFAWRAKYPGNGGRLQRMLDELEKQKGRHLLWEMGLFANEADLEKAKQLVLEASAGVGF